MPLSHTCICACECVLTYVLCVYSEMKRTSNPAIYTKFLIASFTVADYCKTLNISCIKISWFNESDILTHFNFGVHEYYHGSR